MASDNHANYGRIGFTVFIGAFALAIALIFLAGVGNRRSEFLVETYYDNPVSGLSVGSAVNFRGVKIGEVREISFANAIYGDRELTTNDFQRVIIVIALDCRRLDIGGEAEAENIVRKFIAAGVRATIASNAVTGMSRIEFNIPTNPQPLSEITWKPRYLQVPPQPSLIENLASSMSRAINTINHINMPGIWSNIAVVASSSAQITKDVSEFVRQERSGASTIMRNLQHTTESADELAEQLKNNPSLLLRPRDPEPLPETK